MADLMNSSEQEFNDLITKYNNFISPSCKISIGSEILTEDNIGDIKIDISVKDTAGMCVFTVRNCYSYEENGFKSEIKSKLILGKSVDVFLGYSDTNQILFKGYVEAINYEFSDSPSITVVCMDAIHVLMQKVTIERRDKQRPLSDIITELLNKERSYISDIEVENIPATGIQIAQNISDYDFIKKIANENGFEFFILAGTAYLRKAKKVKTLITSLEFGESIISFNREVKYKNVSVTVMGKDDGNKVTTKGIDTGMTNTPYIQKSFISNKIIQSGKFNTDDKAKERASIEVQNILESAYSAKLDCIGIPELVPGRYIKLENFDNDFNKKYYITKVSHNFSVGEYIVSLNLSTQQ